MTRPQAFATGTITQNLVNETLVHKHPRHVEWHESSFLIVQSMAAAPLQLPLAARTNALTYARKFAALAAQQPLDCRKQLEPRLRECQTASEHH